MRKLIKKLALALFRGRYAPRSFSKWLVLLFDCCLFFASFWIYVFIKYIYHIDNLSVIKGIIYYEMFHLIPVFVFFLINAFIFGSYQGLVRYSGFGDIKKIAYVSLGTFFLGYLLGAVLWQRGGLAGALGFFLGIVGAVLYDRLVMKKKHTEYTITGYGPQP